MLRDYHNRELFAEPYAPEAFTYAVRRNADTSPEGTVAIEATYGGAGGDPVPIRTLTNHISHGVATGNNESSTVSVPFLMDFRLDTATNIRFSGDKYLHAWVHHQFSGEGLFSSLMSSNEQIHLVANARQFSSFILIIGRITSDHSIEPSHAVIVKDKDYLRIPLNMEVIPTAQEFRDATVSLSPEQQSFAKAFRKLQLSNSIFALVVVQIKPQLEKVLNLPPDSLIKEIKLTQDLMELFIDYQIPTDLLAFSGDDSSIGVSGRLNAVKDAVSSMKVK